MWLIFSNESQLISLVLTDAYKVSLQFEACTCAPCRFNSKKLSCETLLVTHSWKGLITPNSQCAYSVLVMWLWDEGLDRQTHTHTLNASCDALNLISDNWYARVAMDWMLWRSLNYSFQLLIYKPYLTW